VSTILWVAFPATFHRPIARISEHLPINRPMAVKFPILPSFPSTSSSTSSCPTNSRALVHQCHPEELRRAIACKGPPWFTATSSLGGARRPIAVRAHKSGYAAAARVPFLDFARCQAPTTRNRVSAPGMSLRRTHSHSSTNPI
jgi:hypothetical protein